METRRDIWRRCLMQHDIDQKRHVYYTFIKGGDNISEETRSTIKADMPRTYHGNEWVRDNKSTLEALLVSYATIQRGDSYLQGFNYTMTLLLYVFKDTEHAEADTWWCFSQIVGLIRPLMPDFNVTWFHWYRKHWMGDFRKRLQLKRPILNSIIENEQETFSSLLTVKWFMLWFAQTVDFDEIFELWDFLIQLPPEKLMLAYTLLTYEILCEIAPNITYNWTQHPTGCMHSILKIKVTGISNILENVRGSL